MKRLSYALIAIALVFACSASVAFADPVTFDGVGEGSANINADTEPASQPQPRIIISSVSTKPNIAKAGKPCELSITLHNTSSTQALTNMKVSLGSDETDFSFAKNSAGSHFISSLGRGQYTTITYDLDISPSAKSEPHKLSLHIDYQAGDSEFSSDETFVIKVKQPMRVQIDEIKFPPEVNAGETLAVPLNVMNLGLDTIYNVRATIKVDGLIQEKTAFLGNIESGAAGAGELYAFAAGKGADAESAALTQGDEAAKQNTEDMYGDIMGTLTVAYEDSYGKVYKKTYDVAGSILPPVIDAVDEDDGAEEAKAKTPWLVATLSLFAVIAGVLIASLIIKRKKEHANTATPTPFDDNDDLLE